MTEWARKKGVQGSFEELCKREDLKTEIGQDMAKLAKSNALSSLEKPKEFMLHSELFSVDNDMLTSTFKLKRNVAKVVMKPYIDEMYERVEQAEAARSNRQ